MSLAVWQSSIVDEEGNTLPFAQVEIRDAITNDIVEIFDNRDGTGDPIDQPFSADATGFARFYVIGGAYRIITTYTGFERTYEYVAIGTSAERDEEYFQTHSASLDEIAEINISNFGASWLELADQIEARGVLDVYSTGEIDEILASDYRTIIHATRTYYVRTDGNDLNDGLTDSAAGAFLTLQRALDELLVLDGGDYAVNIQLRSGVFTTAVDNIVRNFQGIGLSIIGDITTPSNVIIRTTHDNAICIDTGRLRNSPITIRGFKFEATGGGIKTVIAATLGQRLTVGSLIFGTGCDIHYNLGYGTILRRVAGSTFILETSGTNHISATHNVDIDLSGVSYTLTGAPAFSDAFIKLDNDCFADFTSTVFTGSAAGIRFKLGKGCLLGPDTAYDTFLPGNTVGTFDTDFLLPFVDNIYTGDQHFGSNYPWVDVVAEGADVTGLVESSADFTAAFAKAQLTPSLGGTVLVPPGVYHARNLVVPSGVRVVGSGKQCTTIFAWDDDDPMVRCDGSGTIEGVTLYGKGTNQDTGTFGASSDTIVLDITGSNSLFRDLSVLGGYTALRVSGADNTFMDITSLGAYGPANVEQRGANWFLRCKFDHSQLGVNITDTRPYAAWAALVPVTVGQARTTGGYVIVCTGAGITGAVAPTLRNWGIDISDGSATWQLSAPVNYTGMLFTGASVGENSFYQVDLSGDYSESLIFDTSSSQSFVFMTASICSAPVLFRQGRAFRIGSSELTGVIVETGYTGTFDIHGCTAPSGAWDIDIGAGVSNFSVTDSELDEGTITVAPGASDYYVIVDNRKCTVIDGGTGVNKTTYPNGDGEVQPRDADLTAIAALTTQAFGRSVLTWVNAVAGRSALELQDVGFRARLSAAQTGISSGVYTKITFNTEDYDTGGTFDATTNYRWTPPAGIINLSLQAQFQGSVAITGLGLLSIYKNGALAWQDITFSITGGIQQLRVNVMDRANGTDYYEAYAYITCASGTGTVIDTDEWTWFGGTWLAP